jgi:apolipoprotein N-acyltransferase
MRSIPLRLWALAILSALLQVLPFPIAGPAPLWRRLFCWFCLTPLLLAVLSNDRAGKRLRPAQTAMLAYLSGFLWYMGNCYWIYQTMHIYGEIPRFASIGILILFSMYVALYHALFGALIGLLRRKFSSQAVLWAAPFLWVAVELARALITGFPWDLLGYTQVDNLLLTRLAPWTGVMGLSFVVALVNSLWISRLTFRGKKSFAPAISAAILFIAAISLVSILRNIPKSSTSASAVLLQENINVGAQGPIVAESKDQMLAAFTQLSLHPGFAGQNIPGPTTKPQIIAWPEAPTEFIDGDPAFRQALGALAVQAKTPVVVNSISIGQKNSSGHFDEYNSADFFQPDGSYAGHYDKMRLVPFGEYVPYKPLFFFAGDLLGSLPFVPGLQRRLFPSGGKQYGVFICYESIFGDDIRHFAADGAQVLVNISDDGWYGDSSAPWEHLDMVRMRAIENSRWIIRATNTGITAAIDPLGRITATMPRHIRGSIEVGFDYSSAETFYTLHGDWFGWLCAIVTAVLLAMAHTKRAGTVVTA